MFWSSCETPSSTRSIRLKLHPLEVHVQAPTLVKGEPLTRISGTTVSTGVGLLAMKVVVKGRQ